MDVFKEHMERYQDPLLNDFRKIALEVADKYKPQHIHHLKLELNLDTLSKSVIINMLTFNL